MNITVVGLGKIGLPLAVQCAGRGHTVVGADVDPRVVAAVSAGTPPFPGEHDLDRQLQDVVTGGALTATTDTRTAVSSSDAVIVVVPLYVDRQGNPDFDAMDAATKEIAAGLRPGTLVVYETTLPVGTTRTRFAPALEQGSGLGVGHDLFVAFSPERVLSGRVFADLRRYPKLVGGVDVASADRTRALYEAVLHFEPRDDLPRPNGVWDLGSSEAAELAKLAETTYRDVNIGLANQFALFAHQSGIDITAVIDACNSQPFSHIHRPGIAVGGHCIPVYPQFYLWNDPAATIVRSARQANETMPERLVALLEAEHGALSGARVVVLGAAYRGGVKETAFSGVFPTVAALERRGADVSVTDPLFSDEELMRFGLRPYRTGSAVDAAVLQADHPQYAGLGPSDLPGIRTLLDGRDLLSRDDWPGVRVISLAAGAPPRAHH